MEQCGYKMFEIECGQERYCDGYNPNCPMYTTHGHVIEFEEICDFDEMKDLRSLERKVIEERRLERYYNQNLYGDTRLNEK